MARKRLPGEYRAGWDRVDVTSEFLAAVKKYAPEVLKRLHADVLPVYRRLRHGVPSAWGGDAAGGPSLGVTREEFLDAAHERMTPP